MTVLPEIFKERMQKLLGENAEQFFASYNNPPVRGMNYKIDDVSDTKELPDNNIFIWTQDFCRSARSENRRDLEGRKVFRDEAMRQKDKSKWKCYCRAVPSIINFSKPDSAKNSVPWCKTGRYYTDERPAKTIAYHAGLFYIQEPSAMCPAEVLGAEPGQRVLDICAAPGGKSVQIAGKMRGEGLLVSNDASASRSRALVKNLERAGVTNAIVLIEQPRKLAARFPEFFDRILVDAPCSGEGMFRRDPDAIKAYTANKPETCAVVQSEILRHAAKMLAPGGRMVYSTCTFNRVENEDVIEAFLQKHPDFALVEIDHSALGIQAGFDAEQKTARIWPHLSCGEGHFIALIERFP